MKALLFAVLLPAAAIAERPADWAQKVAGGSVGNLFRVTDDLYRCAQPTAAGFAELEKLGIRTVINLRNFHDDTETGERSNLRLVRVKMRAWDVEKTDIVRVLALLRQKDQGPFLIHCQHGADRTGLVVALHRIVDLGWKKEDALAEMRQGGFGYHKIWRNLPRLIERLDDAGIARLRERIDEVAWVGV